MLQHSDSRDAVIEVHAWFMITVRASEASEHATDETSPFAAEVA